MKVVIGLMYGEKVEVDKDSPAHKLILWLQKENDRLAPYEVDGKMYQVLQGK